MGERLVVRWAFLERFDQVHLMLGFCGALAVTSSGTIDDVSLRALGLSGGIVVLTHVLLGVRSRHTLDPRGWSSRGRYSARTVPWTAVVDVTWNDDVGPDASGGVSAVLSLADGSRRRMQAVAEHRVFDVDEWLREHQPDIRIDPTSPWRDRFGTWHVVEPGYDPVETMTSVRRSLVGPWEIVARSCDGGFRAEQRVVKSGAVVHAGAVRETLAEAKADGVRLVRDSIVAASSAHE